MLILVIKISSCYSLVLLKCRATVPRKEAVEVRSCSQVIIRINILAVEPNLTFGYIYVFNLVEQKTVAQVHSPCLPYRILATKDDVQNGMNVLKWQLEEMYLFL